MNSNYLMSAAFASIAAISCTKEKPKPNVLFILADDYGYHDMSCTGSKFYETPNIDKIANQGVRFSNGYATCQVSSPSRASIMNGQFPARHGITDWIGAPEGKKWRSRKRYNKLLPAYYKHQLAAEDVTLPEAMKEAGYTTFFAGKWHLGDKGSWPEDHGFDINKGGWTVGGPRGRGFFTPYGNPKLSNGPKGENLSMRLASETVKFLNEHNPKKTGKPVFAYLSFYAVHAPIQTTQEKWSKFRDKAENLGIKDKGYKMGHFLPIRQVQDNPVYGGLVETMDDAVGTVLDELKKLGLDDNTIVVFTSDNGGVSAGDNFSTSNLPLRGGKGYQYEGGIREPYFIKVPWMKNAGKVCHTPVSGTDFYPTLLELTGQKLKPNNHKDGVSLVPLLEGKQVNERSLIWHYPHYGNQGGEPSGIIRKGDWKLIHYYEDNRKELFNLANDLEEQNNLAKEKEELVAQLDNELMSYLKEVKANMPQHDPKYDANKEQEYLKNVEEKWMPSLEKSRLKVLDKNFKPNKDWWGSQVIED
jgi:arylsulfatase A-like enzyme